MPKVMTEKCWFHGFGVIPLKEYSKNSGIYEHCMALPGVENSLDFLNQKLPTILDVLSPTCLPNPPLQQPTTSQLALAPWHVNWGNCSQGASRPLHLTAPFTHSVSPKSNCLMPSPLPLRWAYKLPHDQIPGCIFSSSLVVSRLHRLLQPYHVICFPTP